MDNIEAGEDIVIKINEIVAWIKERERCEAKLRKMMKDYEKRNKNDG